MSSALPAAVMADARLHASSRWRRRARILRLPAWAWLVSLSSVLGACAGPEPSAPSASRAPPPRREPIGPRVELAYSALDGSPITTDRLLHRFTVVGLIATYDPASQTQAIYLRELARRHRPRINVLLLVLEPPENLPMVQAFAEVLDAPFPVALADEETTAGHGPFGELRAVPSVVVLDRAGREAWRHVGQTDIATLDEVLRSLEGGGASQGAGAPDAEPPAAGGSESGNESDEGS